MKRASSWIIPIALVFLVLFGTESGKKSSSALVDYFKTASAVRTLRDADVPLEEYQSAMAYLSKNRHPEVVREALRREEDEKDVIRKTWVSALRSFPDYEAFVLLKNRVQKDPSLDIRLIAIEALSQTGHLELRRVLSEFALREQQSDEERVALHLKLLSFASESGEDLLGSASFLKRYLSSPRSDRAKKMIQSSIEKFPQYLRPLDTSDKL